MILLVKVILIVLIFALSVDIGSQILKLFRRTDNWEER